MGLGKTIEAGMILREYMDRGLVKKFLILVPASLGFQWTNEMVNKFKIDDIFFNRKGRGWMYFDHQIASLDKAKRKNHARYLKQIDFDMVIVDEAHRLKNRDTLNWKFVNSLKKKYCLLLTATPIQNNLKELYNLITILYPDLYKDYKDFKDRYVAGKHLVKNSDQLKVDLDKVMIRNSHDDTGLVFPERHIHQVTVELTPEERELYNKVTSYVKDEYNRRRVKKISILNLLTYQRELCSSSFALQRTLARSRDKSPYLRELYGLARNIRTNAKIKEVEKILKGIDGQAIIFTEYRATQEFIAHYLEKRGYKTILFNGALSSSGKEWIKYIFQQKKDVLISTEAGSQGLNLQFCNVIINYDLPWNPMKIEQRIGRVHRLGQTKDVLIYNLATKDTIEEKILNLLYNKINLFKEIIGNMENIIINPRDGKKLEGDIIKVISQAKDDKDLERGFDELTKKFTTRKELSLT
ncbi:helicase domain protein [Halothermothrix orenii H 168]|uniref:Helicase domain protein n=1 Tax=Halothermothrix orenii (strain H 168 / OCM 544 / DSM 9562) TaxID=373903 RepID=B8CWH2_HALOH|nr:helicase domain protein [Halothermothrix orenii H 168]